MVKESKGAAPSGGLCAVLPKDLSKDISDILEGSDRTEKENCIFLANYFYLAANRSMKKAIASGLGCYGFVCWH